MRTLLNRALCKTEKYQLVGFWDGIYRRCSNTVIYSVDAHTMRIVGMACCVQVFPAVLGAMIDVRISRVSPAVQTRTVTTWRLFYPTTVTAHRGPVAQILGWGWAVRRSMTAVCKEMCIYKICKKTYVHIMYVRDVSKDVCKNISLIWNMGYFYYPEKNMIILTYCISISST